MGTGTTTNSENGNTALDDSGTTRRQGDETTRRRDDETTGRRDDETTRRRDDETMGHEGEEAHRTEKGPGDVSDISWATGKFFFLFSHFILLLLTIFRVQILPMERRGTTRRRRREPGTQHPQPRPRATARGVETGSRRHGRPNDSKTTTTTTVTAPNSHCEQLGGGGGRRDDDDGTTTTTATEPCPRATARGVETGE